MLKLRLKRAGRKGSPSYRLVIMEHSSRRDGRPIDEIGFYNPITKQSFFDVSKIEKWMSNLLCIFSNGLQNFPRILRVQT